MSSQHLKEHQEELSAAFPRGDLISERCLCNGVLQASPAGGANREGGNKNNKGGLEDKENRIMNSRLEAFSYLPC